LHLTYQLSFVAVLLRATRTRRSLILWRGEIINLHRTIRMILPILISELE